MDYDALRKRILDELGQQPTASQSTSQQNHARALGLFLAECLKNFNLSRSDFASALDMDRELADAILDGILPVAELDDAILDQISVTIGCEPELLKLFLV